jgi:O-antigen/teichoic acid export membrane protein
LLRIRAFTSVALSGLYLAGVAVSGNRDLAPLVAVILASGWSRDFLALGRERGVRSSEPNAVRGVKVLVGAAAVTGMRPSATVVGLAYAAGAAASLLLNPHDESERAPMTLDAWVLLAVLMAQIYTSLDTALLAALRSTREAGIYAAIYRIPLAWVTVVGLMVSAFVPVATSALRDDPQQLAALRRQALRAGGLGALAVLVTIPVALPFIGPLFGDAFTSGRVPLALVLVATAVATFSSPLGALYLAEGRDRVYALVLTGGAVANVAANLVLIPTFGMTGAGATTVASESIVCALLLVLARR